MRTRLTTLGLCLALIGTSDISEAQDFGRLFTSRAQRDAMRSGVMPGSDELTALTVNGVVIRPRKQKVGWIDNKSTLDAPYPGVRLVDVRGTTDAPVLPLVVGNARTLTMKPGQVWLPAEDRVVEAYEVPALNAAASPQPAKESAKDAGDDTGVAAESDRP